ncbi:MAG TPA: SusC/RagA family TonB-linked outer membrane protein [Gemmatimonadales bacterium]|nr:SusC/RagA family TonB-linked outer membrane protein [Gemmatimonadales bacterium]
MRRAGFITGALLAVLCAVPLRAQQTAATVRGQVVDDATKQPIAGAQVSVAGRTALSGADGRYVISGVRAGSDTVRARRIGYAPATQAVTVLGNATVVADFSLSPQAVGLAEIVVTGYGTQSAGDITGAVSQISAEEFNTGTIATPQLLIQDKVAGVQVLDNNQPGGGLSIRIRGATSVNASSEPLYVIDGMPVGTGAGGGLSAGRDPLNFLNPNDIASITVLKDASSAAIYGANAANGVVLITTKSGSGGRHGTQIEYTTTFSSSSVTRTPQLLNATQFRAAVAANAPSKSTLLGSANTNWYDQIDRTGYGTDQNLSVTSSGDNTFYRLSLGYFDQQGIIQQSATQRLSLGFNYDQRLFNDRLDLKANVKGSRAFDTFQAGDVLGNATGMAPTQPVYDPTNATGYWDWPTNQSGPSNPVASLKRSVSQGTTWRSVGNVQAEYRLPFVANLKANVNLGYDLTQANSANFQPNNLAFQIRQNQGFLSLSNNSQTNEVVEAYLNYAAPLNFVPGNIDLTGGYSYSQSHGEYPYFQETGLPSNLLGINGISVGGASVIQNSTNIVDYKLISWFGRFNWNLNDRYLLAASVRRDGSSRFGPGNQWGTFPSVSLAWRVSEEPLLKDIRALTDLKIRASWAKTGNQAFADYQQYPTYTYSNGQAQYYFNGQYTTTIRPSAVDPAIHWETTNSYNVGLDFAFFRNRLSGSFDWYTKKTTDLIFTVPVAAGTNFSNLVTQNIGSMRNTGVELSLSAKILEAQRSGLGWTADFTIAHNANKLLTINGSNGVTQIQVGGTGSATGQTIQVLQPGYAINSFLVCQQAYQSGKPVQNTYVLPNGTTTTGCTSADWRPYKSPWPSLELGHTSSFTYSNFDFGFTLRASLGNYVYNNIAANGGSYQNITSGNVWPANIDASVLKTGFTAPQWLSDYYVQDASFLRMDNITLGYSFNVSGRRWRVYATVQNAFTITGYQGVDPTAAENGVGIDSNIYPRSRTFTGGLSVRF